MIALVRDVSPRLDACELTHQGRVPIETERARSQHREFCRLLKELGVEVERVAALPEYADGVFVEDTAVVLPEIAVLARPGARSRQAEVDSVEPALARYRRLERVLPPGTLDGGDVLTIGKTLWVGTSGRTNPAGRDALARMVAPFGYDVKAVELRDCLHLKTAVTFVPPHFVVVNPAWVATEVWKDLTVIAVDADEPFAANTLTVAGTTLVVSNGPKTEARLRDAGIFTRAVDISELQKAEAGLTCLALIFEQR